MCIKDQPLESVEDKIFAISIMHHPFSLGKGIRGLRPLFAE